MATNDSGGARVANNGRPSLGGLMKDAFRVDAWRRERGRGEEFERLQQRCADIEADAEVGGGSDDQVEVSTR